MFLSERFETALNASTRKAGMALFSANRVKFSGFEDSLLQAQIKDRGRTHHVELGLKADGDLICACDCFAFRKGFCSHIWATILQVDILLQSDDDVSREFSMNAGRSAGSATVDDEPNDGLPNAEGSGAEESMSTRPDWQRQLERIQANALSSSSVGQRTGAASTEELLYVLEPSESRDRRNLTIRTYAVRRTKSGDSGAMKPRRVRSEKIPALEDPLDVQLWSILSSMTEGSSERWSQYTKYRESDNLIEIPAAAADVLLGLLVATRRFLIVDESHYAEKCHELSFSDNQDPWRLRLRVQPDDDGWYLDGYLRRGSDEMDLSVPALLLPCGWLVRHTSICPFNDEDAFAWVSTLRAQGGIQVSKEDSDRFLENMWSSPVLPPTDWPEALHLREISEKPTPRLYLDFAEGDHRAKPKLRAQIEFDYGGTLVRDGAVEGSIIDVKSRTRVARWPDQEAEYRQKLFAIGFEAPSAQLLRSGLFEEHQLQLAATRLAASVESLTSAGWHVRAEGQEYRGGGTGSVSVKSGIDWFDVKLAVKFGEQQVELPALLRALKARKSWVDLGDGTRGVLPHEWLESHGLLIGAGRSEGDALRFDRNQTFFLDALLAREEHVHFDKRFEKARAQIAEFEGLAPVNPDSSFVGELRPYQREGLGWLHFLRRFSLGGCLADDMGLGKTVQVLALLDGIERDKPSLIVVPRSLIFNWLSEVQRFTPQLSVLDFSGSARVRDAAHLAAHDIVLTTYGTLVRDADFLSEIPFEYAILDEAQAIKNARTTFAKAARLIRADHRLALSGTPIENHIGELWSLFEFLNPGMLGSARAFSKFTGKEKTLGKKSVALVADAIRPMVLRRTKREVATDLPDRTEQTLVCNLEPGERKIYDELRDHYRSVLLKTIDDEGIKESKMKILEALLRMRQVACHVGLVDESRRSEPSAKIDMLMSRLGDIVDEGHKVLVFSQFTKLLAIVRERLDESGIEYAYLDGKTRKRDEKVEQFQNDPDCQVFLISLKAGGVGLNLTAAEYVFLLDPWWNPAAESQAIDRAHRIGQTKKVVAYRLISADTVEEKVLELQDKKRDLAASILGDGEGNGDGEGSGGILRNLKREDLEALLS